MCLVVAVLHTRAFAVLPRASARVIQSHHHVASAKIERAVALRMEQQWLDCEKQWASTRCKYFFAKLLLGHLRVIPEDFLVCWSVQGCSPPISCQSHFTRLWATSSSKYFVI